MFQMEHTITGFARNCRERVLTCLDFSEFNLLMERDATDDANLVRTAKEELSKIVDYECTLCRVGLELLEKETANRGEADGLLSFRFHCELSDIWAELYTLKDR